MWLFKRKAAPYTLQDEIFTSNSPFCIKLYNGTRVADQKEFSIFEFKPDQSDFQQALALNAIKSWKTFRHPTIPLYTDTYEDNGITYVVTEKVLPFDPSKLTNSELTWAIYVMTGFVAFLSDSQSVHGNIFGDALFMTAGHELKIAGLHWLTVNGIGPTFTYRNEWIQSVPLASPDPFDGAPQWAIDIRFVGKYLDEWAQKLPKVLLKNARRWQPNSRQYPNPTTLLNLEYWTTDKFVQYLLFLRDLPLKDQFEREQFFKNLHEHLDNFSPETQQHTILPTLMSTLSFAQTPAILEAIVAIGKTMNETDFGTIIVPQLISLFEVKERSLRLQLLSQIEILIPHLDKKILNDKIFGNIIFGLMDTASQVKTATIIAMAPLAPHLTVTNSRTLVRELKKLQSDQDPQIRANTIICIAKIADFIDDEIRLNTLTSCLAKAATDPFPQCRLVAISAYRTCQKYFNNILIASSIMPVVSPLCMDQNLNVKISALKSMKQYVDLLSEDLPEQVPEEPKPQNSQQQQQNVRIPPNTHEKSSTQSNVESNTNNNVDEEEEMFDEEIYEPPPKVNRQHQPMKPHVDEKKNIRVAKFDEEPIHISKASNITKREDTDPIRPKREDIDPIRNKRDEINSVQRTSNKVTEPKKVNQVPNQQNKPVHSKPTTMKLSNKPMQLGQVNKQAKASHAKTTIVIDDDDEWDNIDWDEED